MALKEISPNGMDQVALAAVVTDLAVAVREIKTDLDLNAAALAGILTKLDADGGVTDVNYAALYSASGSSAPCAAATSFPLPTSDEDAAAHKCTPTR